MTAGQGLPGGPSFFFWGGGWGSRNFFKLLTYWTLDLGFLGSSFVYFEFCTAEIAGNDFDLKVRRCFDSWVFGTKITNITNCRLVD